LGGTVVSGVVVEGWQATRAGKVEGWRAAALMVSLTESRYGGSQVKGLVFVTGFSFVALLT
jgi:hypothetical protein